MHYASKLLINHVLWQFWVHFNAIFARDLVCICALIRYRAERDFAMQRVLIVLFSSQYALLRENYTQVIDAGGADLWLWKGAPSAQNQEIVQSSKCRFSRRPN